MKKINNAGQMTLDFIFAFVLVMGLTGILFSLSLSLTVASVTQYITYASGRSYFASHITFGRQQAQASQKFDELESNPAFATLFNGDWFEVNRLLPIVTEDNNSAILPYQAFFSRAQEYGEKNLVTNSASDGEVVNKFAGVGADLTARMLDFQIPFFGSTNPESQQKGDGFRAFLASYMPYEPSQLSCRRFLNNKWTAIRTLHDSYGNAPNTNADSYALITDNGC